MARTLKQLIRSYVPNIPMRIPHVESEARLEVRLGQHLGLIARGAKSYESVYVGLLRSLINPGDRVFDIGANIGFYSVLFSRWVGPTGTVFAYEPDSDNLKLLARNVGLNNCGNIRIRGLAIADEVGEKVFSRDKVTGSTGHLGSGLTYAETMFGRSREFLMPVEVTTLDREVEMWGAPDVMKLDVEGGEFDVLGGGQRVLSNQRPVVISEMSRWDVQPETGAFRSSAAFKLLADLDYLIWNVDSGCQIREAKGVWMVLGVPRERLKESRIERALSTFSVRRRDLGAAS